MFPLTPGKIPSMAELDSIAHECLKPSYKQSIKNKENRLGSLVQTWKDRKEAEAARLRHSGSSNVIYNKSKIYELIYNRITEIEKLKNNDFNNEDKLCEISDDISHMVSICALLKKSGAERQAISIEKSINKLKEKIETTVNEKINQINSDFVILIKKIEPTITSGNWKALDFASQNIHQNISKMEQTCSKLQSFGIGIQNHWTDKIKYLDESLKNIDEHLQQEQTKVTAATAETAAKAAVENEKANKERAEAAAKNAKASADRAGAYAAQADGAVEKAQAAVKKAQSTNIEAPQAQPIEIQESEQTEISDIQKKEGEILTDEQVTVNLPETSIGAVSAVPSDEVSSASDAASAAPSETTDQAELPDAEAMQALQNKRRNFEKARELSTEESSKEIDKAELEETEEGEVTILEEESQPVEVSAQQKKEATEETSKSQLAGRFEDKTKTLGAGKIMKFVLTSLALGLSGLAHTVVGPARTPETSTALVSINPIDLFKNPTTQDIQFAIDLGREQERLTSAYEESLVQKAPPQQETPSQTEEATTTEIPVSTGNFTGALNVTEALKEFEEETLDLKRGAEQGVQATEQQSVEETSSKKLEEAPPPLEDMGVCPAGSGPSDVSSKASPPLQPMPRNLTSYIWSSIKPSQLYSKALQVMPFKSLISRKELPPIVIEVSTTIPEEIFKDRSAELNVPVEAEEANQDFENFFISEPFAEELARTQLDEASPQSEKENETTNASTVVQENASTIVKDETMTKPQENMEMSPVENKPTDATFQTQETSKGKSLNVTTSTPSDKAKREISPSDIMNIAESTLLAMLGVTASVITVSQQKTPIFEQSSDELLDKLRSGSSLTEQDKLQLKEDTLLSDVFWYTLLTQDLDLETFLPTECFENPRFRALLLDKDFVSNVIKDLPGRDEEDEEGKLTENCKNNIYYLSNKIRLIPVAGAEAVKHRFNIAGSVTDTVEKGEIGTGLRKIKDSAKKFQENEKLENLLSKNPKALTFSEVKVLFYLQQDVNFIFNLMVYGKEDLLDKFFRHNPDNPLLKNENFISRAIKERNKHDNSGHVILKITGQSLLNNEAPGVFEVNEPASTSRSQQIVDKTIKSWADYLKLSTEEIIEIIFKHGTFPFDNKYEIDLSSWDLEYNQKKPWRGPSSQELFNFNVGGTGFVSFLDKNPKLKHDDKFMLALTKAFIAYMSFYVQIFCLPSPMEEDIKPRQMSNLNPETIKNILLKKEFNIPLNQRSFRHRRFKQFAINNIDQFVPKIGTHRHIPAEYADDTLKTNEDFVLSAAEITLNALENTPLIQDQNFLLRAIDRLGAKALKYANKEWLQDENFMMDTIQKAGAGAFAWADSSLKKRPDFVLWAIENAGVDVLELIDSDLLENDQFMLSAIKINYEAVIYLEDRYELWSGEKMGNKIFEKESFKDDVIGLISPQWRKALSKSAEEVLRIFETLPTYIWKELPLDNLPSNFREIFLEAAKISRDKFLTAGLNQNNANERALMFTHPSLLKDPGFMLLAIEQIGFEVLRSIQSPQDGTLVNDSNFMLQAAKKDPRVEKYLHPDLKKNAQFMRNLKGITGSSSA